MIEIIRFETAHVGNLLNCGGQEHLVSMVRAEDLDIFATRGRAWSAISEGRVIACAGFLEANRFRATAWALFSKGSPIAFTALHKAVRCKLNEQPYRLIEAYVDPQSFPAMRWIKLLGFQLRRAYLPYFFPDGSGASEWVYFPRHEQG